MIKVTAMSFGYSFGALFDKVSFSVGKGFKVGLVGPNGAGKSTLFTLLMGRDSPSAGRIELSGTVGHVPQEVKHDPDLEQAPSIPVYLAPDRKKEAHELQSMMHGLELDMDLDVKPQLLSGGQKTKLAILKALIAEPDILLLDEPTNFLDQRGKHWFMEFLSHYPKTLIMISHDLDLLDAYIDKVLAINPLTKSIDEYKGNYTKYLQLKKEREELLKKQIINEQKHIKHMERGLQRMARNTSKKGVRQRTLLRRRVEKLKANLPELPKEIRRIRVTIPDPPRTGELPIRAKDIVKVYAGEIILPGVSLTLHRNERVALVGPNGAGKSTFIKTLVGLITPEEGEIEIDPTVTIGYYSQEFETFDFEKTILEIVEGQTDLPTEKIRPFLGTFNFPGTRIYQKISTLSGGEKTRLSIALLMMRNNNLLILDEPTTYLDVLSQRIILEALKQYKGAMIFVSHTEEFVAELQPNRVLWLPENKITFWLPEFVEKVGIL